MSVLQAVLAAGGTDPVGPGGWTAGSWLGALLYVGLFLVALWGISRLGASGLDEEEERGET
jgi:hypothetical protein